MSDQDCPLSPSSTPQTRAAPPTQRASRKEQRARTREGLLDAAVRVVLEMGYAHCSLAAVAAEAGTTTGALQHHFGSRAELIESVLIERLFPVARSAPLPSQVGRPLGERCRSVVDLLWRDVYGRPSYPATWDIVLGARRDPDLRERIRRFQRESAEVGLDAFRAALDGLGFSRRELADIQVLVCTNLRGLALFRPFDYEERFLSGQVKSLARVLEHDLAARLAERTRSGDPA